MMLKMRPEFERLAGAGQWHGGPIAAAIDVAGDYALAMLFGTPLPTINLRVDYLRPAKDTLTLIAYVRRSGKTVGVVDVDVRNEAGELVAIGRGELFYGDGVNVMAESPADRRSESVNRRVLTSAPTSGVRTCSRQIYDPQQGGSRCHGRPGGTYTSGRYRKSWFPTAERWAGSALRSRRSTVCRQRK